MRKLTVGYEHRSFVYSEKMLAEIDFYENASFEFDRHGSLIVLAPDNKVVIYPSGRVFKLIAEDVVNDFR